MKINASSPPRPPTRQQGTSLVSAHVATQSQASPASPDFFLFSGVLTAFEPTKPRISSAWMRLHSRFWKTRS